MKWFLIVLFSSGFLLAQDFRVGISANQSKGYSYEVFPFPNNMVLYDMERQKTTPKALGLTLVMVWTTKVGYDPTQWERVLSIIETNKAAGLEFFGVNFENGTNFQIQRDRVQEFFSRTTPMEPNYLDVLGYAMDFLKVPSFPTYFLVSDQNVVFYTRGSDKEGMDLLEMEIANHLEK